MHSSCFGWPVDVNLYHRDREPFLRLRPDPRRHFPVCCRHAGSYQFRRTSEDDKARSGTVKRVLRPASHVVLSGGDTSKRAAESLVHRLRQCFRSAPPVEGSLSPSRGQPLQTSSSRPALVVRCLDGRVRRDTAFVLRVKTVQRVFLSGCVFEAVDVSVNPGGKHCFVPSCASSSVFLAREIAGILSVV